MKKMGEMGRKRWLDDLYGKLLRLHLHYIWPRRKLYGLIARPRGKSLPGPAHGLEPAAQQLRPLACQAGSCPAGSLSSWPIPAVVYEPANSNRHAAYSQQKQVAPTILKALGLNSSTLKGVATEGMQLASWVLMVAWM